MRVRGCYRDGPAALKTPISRLAAYVRGARPSRERANTSNTAIIGIVRGVRDVRDFRECEKLSRNSAGVFLSRVCFPVLHFKLPTSRTPRSMPTDIGEIACAVRRGTAKQRTWSSGRVMIWSASTHPLRAHNSGIKGGVRVVCLTNVSLGLVRRLRNRPLGHFWMQPVLRAVAFLE